MKLYERNSYLKENITNVSSCTEEEGVYKISLEDTIFFPEEGGQYADTGYLKIIGRSEEETGDVDDYIRILDGQIEDGVILYTVDRKIEAGTAVECHLDFDKRYDRMQNHSGEHILTSIIHNKYGYVNKGFHLSDDSPVTLDISGPMTYEEVIEMEREANKIIYANLPIVDSYPTDEELKSISYRSKIEIKGQVRLITIGTEKNVIDICACCAPHVARTGEVGIIKVVGVVNWKGGVRISMLAGRRALEYIGCEHELIRELTGILTTSAENVAGLVKSHIKEIGELKSKLGRAIEEMVLERIEANHNLSEKSHFEFVGGDFPASSMKNIFNVLAGKYEGYSGIFAGDDENGYRYNAGSNNLDARILGDKLRSELGAKGGGKEDMIQGQVRASKEDICKIINSL